MRVSADEIKGWLMLGAIGGAVLFVWSKGGLAGAAGAILSGAWGGVKDALTLATPEELAAQEAAAAPLWSAYETGGIDAYAAEYAKRAEAAGMPAPVTGSGGAAFGVYRVPGRRVTDTGDELARLLRLYPANDPSSIYGG